MEDFLDPHPPWIAIGGPEHLLYVLALLLVAAVLLAARGWVREHRTGVYRTLAVVVVLQQLTLYGFYATTGWDPAETLPLHISRVSALLGLVYLVTGSRRVMDVLFFFGLWAWASFAYPQNIQPPTNILGLSFFVNHAVTLLMPVLAWVTTDWRPSLPGMRRALLWFGVYLVVAVGANAAFGGNYFYQRERPLLPWLEQPWYLLASVAATVVLFCLGYAVSRLLARVTDRARHL
ncbi:YwaF [Serinicoccus hydrothermalis]|uniref:YwaF n=1 Tax=Serinicoccus hydrothermalis TaxID=1758689 RepID=A0A1B1N9P1_9MICO|nr:TIGR02206 family membrane protein [Serinicoccus hydrothermalis]ANS78147.1 YwaF [Serinicoccus hydrothermalis]